MKDKPSLRDLIEHLREMICHIPAHYAVTIVHVIEYLEAFAKFQEMVGSLGRARPGA